MDMWLWSRKFNSVIGITGKQAPIALLRSFLLGFSCHPFSIWDLDNVIETCIEAFIIGRINACRQWDMLIKVGEGHRIFLSRSSDC